MMADTLRNRRAESALADDCQEQRSDSRPHAFPSALKIRRGAGATTILGITGFAVISNWRCSSLHSCRSLSANFPMISMSVDQPSKHRKLHR